MASTRRLLGLALGGLACLAVLAQTSPATALSPRDAPRWEGQAATVQGVAHEVRRDPDGRVRLNLVADGVALPTRLDHAPIPEGAALAVTGRLTRLNGVLTLLGDAMQAAAPPASHVGLEALALHPEDWTGHVVRVGGLVDRGFLQADGIAISLGQGPWPAKGRVEATALLAYEPVCACYRLDQVVQWTG